MNGPTGKQSVRRPLHLQHCPKVKTPPKVTKDKFFFKGARDSAAKMAVDIKRAEKLAAKRSEKKPEQPAPGVVKRKPSAETAVRAGVVAGLVGLQLAFPFKFNIDALYSKLAGAFSPKPVATAQKGAGAVFGWNEASAQQITPEMVAGWIKQKRAENEANRRVPLGDGSQSIGFDVKTGPSYFLSVMDSTGFVYGINLSKNIAENTKKINEFSADARIYKLSDKKGGILVIVDPAINGFFEIILNPDEEKTGAVKKSEVQFISLSSSIRDIAVIDADRVAFVSTSEIGVNDLSAGRPYAVELNPIIALEKSPLSGPIITVRTFGKETAIVLDEPNWTSAYVFVFNHETGEITFGTSYTKERLLLGAISR